MNFCVISPTAGLEAYATKSKYHMVLAHQYLKDEEYRRFYLKRRANDDFILLDNGVYEDSYNEDKYLEAIASLQPDVAVLPDVICKSMESTKLSLDFLKKYEHLFPSTNWMFIPQGETLSHWRASFQCLSHFEDIADVWIGLTRFLPTHTCKQDPLIRVKLAAEIHSSHPWLRMHCMGMADGSLDELRLLAKQKFVKSIDSSAPVWRGWLGFAMQDRLDWLENGKDVDFSAPLSSAWRPSIDRNLEVVLDICNGV